jgi:hypothetical protein
LIASEETVEQALKAAPMVTQLAWEQQGEAICFGLSGKTMFTTSERRPTPITVYEWRTGKTHAEKS